MQHAVQQSLSYFWRLFQSAFRLLTDTQQYDWPEWGGGAPAAGHTAKPTDATAAREHGEGLGQLPPPAESKFSSHEHQQNQMTHDQFDDDLAIAIALSLGDQETPKTSNSESSQQQQDSTPLSSQLAHLSEDEILENFKTIINWKIKISQMSP